MPTPFVSAMKRYFGPTPFVSAMKRYFGFKDGQTLSEFGAELKALSDADKAWFHAELNRIGIECDPPGAITKG